MMVATANAKKTNENHPKFVVICLTETLRLNEKIDRRNWPLHVTLLSWVATDKFKDFEQAVKKLAESTESFWIQTGSKEMFGEKQNIPVTIVVPEQRLNDLQHDLVMLSERVGKILDKRYIGDKYRPHITEYGGKSVPVRSRVRVDNLSIVELIDENTCRFIKRYELKTAP